MGSIAEASWAAAGLFEAEVLTHLLQLLLVKRPWRYQERCFW